MKSFFVKLLESLLAFVVGFVKFSRNILLLSFVFLLGIFILTIFMPQNMLQAIEIFKNLLKIP